MKHYLGNIARALISPKENESLYRSRGVIGAPQGVRNRVTLSVCVLLALFLFVFILSLSVRNNSTENYLADRKNINLIETALSTAYFTVPEAMECASPEACFQQLATKPLFVHTAKDGHLPLPESYVKMEANDKRKMLVVVSVPVDVAAMDPEIADLVVRLPRVFYNRADLFVGGSKVGSTLNRDAMTVPVTREMLATGRLEAHLVLEVGMGQDGRLINWTEEIYVASHYESKKYGEFLSNRRLNSSSQVGMVARVVLAVFVLLLFLIVESSPEALGLALFMGFEACAITMSFMEFKRFWITSDVNLSFLIHYSNAMGDVFRLYFFMQLCRIVKPAPAKWIGYASIYAVIYGLMRHFDVDFGVKDWARYHVAQRDMLASTVGFILCFNTIIHLRNRKVPWRVWALALAGLAATAQWLSAAPTFFPFMREFGDYLFGYNAIISAITANSAYLFALSTFINISTLENRVKVLSGEKARAEAMEKEMQLGRSVQTSFQKIPELPPEMKITIHNEAATFVSGDSYFVHWNQPAEVLTFLLNDVTGHGIQAALKAFACNIVARSLWNRPWIKNDRRLEESMLQKYDLAVTELIHADGDVPDFNAMVGVEVFRDRKTMKLYRVNYSFPIVITPDFDFMADVNTNLDQWSTKEISVGNQLPIELSIKEGAFVVLVSDGFAQNVRQRKSLIDAFKRQVATAGRTLAGEKILETALTWEMAKKEKSNDDKTILIFQWNPLVRADDGDPGTERPLKTAS